MEITAGMVRQLREKTGLPMMECKKALEEAGGNEQQAVELLRKKGLAQASKRAERATGEGRLALHVDAARKRAAMVEVLCETEPVVKTDDFLKLGRAAAEAAVALDTPSVEALLAQPVPGDSGRKIGDLLQDAVNRIRENIRISQVAVASGHFGHYLHHDGRKGVLVEFSGPCAPELAADVCMHIVAMRPMCVRREQVDAALVDAERKIAMEQVRGKPENIVDKIVTGKLNKWFAEIVLLEQLFVKDDKKTVSQVLREAAPDLTVSRYERFEIAKG